MSEIGIGQSAASSGRSFMQRLGGAVRLDPGAFDEIAASPSALVQATTVVLAAAAARVVGVSGITTSTDAALNGLRVLILWPAASVVLWGVANWFGHRVGLGPLLRVVGFAMAPLMLAVFQALPLPTLVIIGSLLATALFFAALLIGVRQALRIDTGRAAFVCLATGLTLFFLLMVEMYLTAPPHP
jgi:hypothetical protein